MSAAWGGSGVGYEPEPKQKRFIRMWSYLIVGTVFYIFLRIKVGF